MSSFINFNEKGQKQYVWSNNIQERIIQLNFQLLRTQNENIINLNSIIRNIFIDLKNDYELNIIHKDVYKDYIIILCSLLANTRDIINGKGEYNLSYNFLNILYDFYPQIAENIYKYFCINLDNLDNFNNLPYGSWKDIKYFYKLFPNHPLNKYGIKLINNQLKEDENNFYNNNFHKISLVSKWIPREKKNTIYYNFYCDLACDYYNQYISYAKLSNNPLTITKAINKAKTHYRKLISTLNNTINTLEIYQCSNNWRNINFNYLTSINLLKQREAFLNMNKHGNINNKYSFDRIQCCNNFIKYIDEIEDNKITKKGKNINLNDFTKEALKLINNENYKIYRNNLDTNLNNDLINFKKEILLLNNLWKSNSQLNNNNLKNMIAIIDLSSSMNGDPLYSAIALGIRVAEKSILGKRILTFSSCPKWVNLENYEFVDCVYYSTLNNWGLNTNFNSASNIILDAIIESKLEPKYVENLTLVVFSDMQFDKIDTNFNSMYDYIENQYINTGLKLYGTPLKPPHILFWNLKNSNGFPCLSYNKNISMMSGFNPSLLNLFCEKGLNGLKEYNNTENILYNSSKSWNLLTNMLNNKRYSIIKSIVSSVIDNSETYVIL